jgi:hypothetical protein
MASVSSASRNPRFFNSSRIAEVSEQDTGNLIFYVFDLLFDDGADLRPQPIATLTRRYGRMLATASR